MTEVSATFVVHFKFNWRENAEKNIYDILNKYERMQMDGSVSYIHDGFVWLQRLKAKSERTESQEALIEDRFVKNVYHIAYELGCVWFNGPYCLSRWHST